MQHYCWLGTSKIEIPHVGLLQRSLSEKGCGFDSSLEVNAGAIPSLVSNPSKSQVANSPKDVKVRNQTRGNFWISEGLCCGGLNLASNNVTLTSVIMSKAYCEGFRAGKAFDGLNPYPPETEEHDQWNLGFDNASNKGGKNMTRKT